MIIKFHGLAKIDIATVKCVQATTLFQPLPQSNGYGPSDYMYMIMRTLFTDHPVGIQTINCFRAL